MELQNRAGDLRLDRTVEDFIEDVRLALASGDEKDLARSHNSADAHGDGSSRHVVEGIKEALVRLARHFGQLHLMRYDWEMVAGLIKSDMPIMTANQAKMVLQIAAAYGHPLSADRVKEIAGVIAGGFVFRGVSRQLAGVIPALGWAVKGTMGYVGTQAIGHAAIEYFEGGGDIAGLAALVGKTTSVAAEAAETVAAKPAVKTVVAAVAPKAKKAAVVALDAAAPVAKSAAKVAWKSLKPGHRNKGKRL